VESHLRAQNFKVPPEASEVTRKLSEAQKKAAALASLASPRTPPRLKEGLRKYAEKKRWLAE
jgi:hypothetical protein